MILPVMFCLLNLFPSFRYRWQWRFELERRSCRFVSSAAAELLSSSLLLQGSSPAAEASTPGTSSTHVIADTKFYRDRVKSLEQDLVKARANAVVWKSKADHAEEHEKFLLASIKEAADELLCKDSMSPRVPSFYLAVTFLIEFLS